MIIVGFCWPLLVAICLHLSLADNLHAQGTSADYERAASLESRTRDKEFRLTVKPHWQPDGTSFWYQNDLSDGKSEFVVVDTESGERRVVEQAPAHTDVPNTVFHARPSRADRTPDTSIRFVNRSGQTVRLFWIDFRGEWKPYGELQPGEYRVQHTYVGHVWVVLDLERQKLGVFEGEDTTIDAFIEKSSKASRSKRRDRTALPWNAFIRDDNVWAKRNASDEVIQLSRDGTQAFPFRQPLRLSPDGSMLVAMQVERGDERRVYLIESSPKDRLQPKLDSYEYPKPGDRIDRPFPRLFNVAEGRQIAVKDDLFPNPWSIDNIHWAPDGSRFFFLYNQRGQQLLRVISVDAATGEARVVVEETSKTFIDYSSKTYLEWLDQTDELIWMSERDGWNHLYLIDTRTGEVKSQITKGEWNVRAVEHIDRQQRQVWLRVMGVNPDEDPYHIHLARVNLDGTGFQVLTDGDGTHQWQWSPDRRQFIDTWSRVDQPPITVLRSGRDGSLICELEQADVSALLATGWPPPERFTAKGRDGETDIHGILFRPSNFDPNRKYPVIELIYAGPQDFFVPKEWSRFIWQQSLAELGFILVQIDGMGTNWRGKAFHDVCWKNLKDAGLPDRIAWMRAAASTRPWMDLSHVGVFGGSAGGQSALGALLFHGDFYKAAMADCGCHDNRVDKIWWNEQWMGWPVGPEYADNSNVTHAHKLQGKLLLVVGELDRNVDPASTMQVVNALIQADKDFDLLVVPGAGHGASGSPYGQRRTMDFLVRHLLGVEPRRD